jgi:hypothetical protein
VQQPLGELLDSLMSLHRRPCAGGCCLLWGAPAGLTRTLAMAAAGKQASRQLVERTGLIQAQA